MIVFSWKSKSLFPIFYKDFSLAAAIKATQAYKYKLQNDNEAVQINHFQKSKLHHIYYTSDSL